MQNAQPLEAEGGLESLLPYCTPAQERTIRAILEAGSVRKGAKALGVSPRNVFAMLARIRKQATRRGHAPEYDLRHPAPPGYAVKGTSTLYDGDGNLRAQWVKTREDRDAIQAAFDAAAGVAYVEAPLSPFQQALADMNRSARLQGLAPVFAPAFALLGEDGLMFFLAVGWLAATVAYFALLFQVFVAMFTALWGWLLLWPVLLALARVGAASLGG